MTEGQQSDQRQMDRAYALVIFHRARAEGLIEGGADEAEADKNFWAVAGFLCKGLRPSPDALERAFAEVMDSSTDLYEKLIANLKVAEIEYVSAEMFDDDMRTAETQPKAEEPLWKSVMQALLWCAVILALARLAEGLIGE